MSRQPVTMRHPPKTARSRCTIVRRSLRPVLIGLLVGAPLNAQVNTQPRRLIEGKVESTDGSPLQDVEISWTGGRQTVFTRADGSFSLFLPGNEVVVVIVRKIGYNAQALRIDFGTNTLWRGSIVLAPGTFRLPDVEVTERSAKPARYSATHKYDDFFRRQRVGLGAFINREQIDKMNSLRTIELLRGIPGIHVNVGPDGARGQTYVKVVRCSGPGSKVNVWVDGHKLVPPMMGDEPAVPEMLSRIDPRAIEMIEVYRGAAQLPGEFHDDGCAAIVIWTRQGAS